MIIFTGLIYIVLMVIFQNYLGNDVLGYLFFLLVSLLLGYLLDKKLDSPIDKLDDYLEKRHPILHELVMIYFPEVFLGIIAIAALFYYI